MTGPTTANLRVRHGEDKDPVDVGEVAIPSGETNAQFQLPETKLTLSNETYGKNEWLVAIPTVNLNAFSYSGEEIIGIDWSNDDQQTWAALPGESVSFEYDTEGESTFWYFATDQDFNAEEPKSYFFKVDTWKSPDFQSPPCTHPTCSWATSVHRRRTSMHRSMGTS